MTARAAYEAKKAHRDVFRFYWPTIGTPLRRPVVSRWGDVDTVRMMAFVCFN